MIEKKILKKIIVYQCKELEHWEADTVESGRDGHYW